MRPGPLRPWPCNMVQTDGVLVLGSLHISRETNDKQMRNPGRKGDAHQEGELKIQK